MTEDPATLAWPTQQLAEFIAAVSAAGTEAAAARVAVERAAEALDADVAAIVSDGGLVAAVGYCEGSIGVGELEKVRPGVPGSRLDVPGTGWCAASAAALDHPPGATLVLARPAGLTREETGLLRGMARVAAMTMRVLSVVEHERVAHDVAMLVARGAPPGEVFAAVAEAVGHFLPPADFTMVGRYEPGRGVEIVGGWSRSVRSVLVGRRMSLGGRNVGTLVFESNQPARVDYLAESEAVTVAARQLGMRSSAGAPIIVEGRLWGVMIAASARESALPAGTEHRLAAFTELIAAAIANAQAREELSTLAEEQAALRRVATLVARGASPRAAFAAVAEEAGRLLPADLTLIGRYEGGLVTGVAGWSTTGAPVPTRSRVSLDGRNVSELVYHTGRPARMDSYTDASGAVAEDARGRGISSAVGAPIIVEGRIWGVMIAASTHDEPLPPSTEERLAGFTELVATAIANAEAQAELTASRARIVATADETRRRIERDLHDGAQQRLVSLALQLRAARAAIPAGLEGLGAQLDRVATGLASTLDELREYARGIHPAILAEGGLAPAIKTLARRSLVPVVLDVRLSARLPERVEVTAYYVISEALANAAKHARASVVHVEVHAAGQTVRICVSDDGVGGADPARGSGLVGLRDRVEATGGSLVLRSHPGEGTLLAVGLPYG
jgi:signal transduction histidine kinase